MKTLSSEKKIAVVSGGAGYLGSAVVRRLVQDGFVIALMYNSSPKQTVDEIITSLPGVGHKAYVCDLKNKDEVENSISTIEKEIGHIYIAVHTAGVVPVPKRLHQSSFEDLQKEFENNIVGSFNFLTACARAVKEHKQGVLVGVTTAGVVTGHNTKSRGLYSVSKFALQGVLTSLKEELEAYNVRVYSVAPGVMEGGMNKATPKAFIDMVRSVSPTKKITDALEVASVISYLCSENSIEEAGLTCLVAPETDVS